MKPFSPTMTVAIAAVFLAGFFSHVLYQRWNPSSFSNGNHNDSRASSTFQDQDPRPQSHRVTFVPLSPPIQTQLDMPLLAARDVEKIRALAGKQARIRGRIFRVGHSAKSNTYFLNFGPSREAFTGVIFASAVELFAKQKLSPKNFEGKEVEISGEIKNHPQYGLEMILETPGQIIVVK